MRIPNSSNELEQEIIRTIHTLSSLVNKVA